MKRKRNTTSKLPAIIVAVLILIVGIGFYQVVVLAKNETNVVTAAHDLPAYSFVSDPELEFTPVPKGSITENDLTEEEYRELYGDGGMVLTAQVLAGQRIDKREVAEGPQESFSVVLPDERVVAATTTLTGAAVGTIQAGNVVDVSTEGGLDGGIGVEFAKVICIANSATDCQGVLPPGVDLSASGSSEGISLLLAVPREAADEVSGKQVTLALNPFCRVDRTGHFVPTREDGAKECNAGDRLASASSGESEDLGESATSSDYAEG